MNEHVVERFRRPRRGARNEATEVQVWMQPQQLNLKIRQYFDRANQPIDGGTWLQRPELPTSDEFLDPEGSSSGSSDLLEIATNKPIGAWASKEEYLGTHYELLREDAIQPLREAVKALRVTPTGDEASFNGRFGIYEKVHICGITTSTKGIAVRVTFSLGRVGKKILWKQSKRLTTGGLVVLTPSNDMFQTTAIVATVAARPLAGLEQNPPEIDLFFARHNELEVDPAKDWVMLEAQASYYEANRHTLLALQMMMREPFPLSEHLVDAQTTVSAPAYVQDQPRADLTSVLHNNKHETYGNVDILKRWPAQPSSELDTSQLAALRRILTKRLAIVQGPPGTGKTHVSVEAIKIMLANRQPDDPPIIIACQTNHAVDQILRYIAKFETDFVRIGGRSKDKDVIKARTLYAVRKQISEPRPAGCLDGSAKRKMAELEQEFALLLTHLKPGKTPLDFRLLEKFGLLTPKQADSLEAGASRWVQDKLSNPNEARSPFTTWLGQALKPVPPKQLPEDFGFDFEEVDLEFEQLKEVEAENGVTEDEDFETLQGTTFYVADNFTCRKVPGLTEDKVKVALRQQDLWKIPEPVRGVIYRYLQVEAKKHILNYVREKAKNFDREATKRRIGTYELNEPTLKKQKIIGMTTTGLSKNRGLLAALGPKVVLIEEAAETLEAPVTVACMPSLEHLILVGDHKQLRPHCNVKSHEDHYYLNVSLFERLVNNNIEFATLSVQRRMIPEIRRLLYPIYGKLIKDHASVLDPENRPNVPGMGGVNSFFFTHQWPERRDEHMSTYNPDEADMIVGFVEYLVHNGMETDDITILTFYNGQRKRLLSILRKKASLLGRKFNVVTVDSYQGEENKVVILSLVRSNNNGQIGFLSIDNRVCVALSRAQCGFYLFGNGMLLYHSHPTWEKVIQLLAGQERRKEAPKVEPTSRLDDQLPLRCSNHDQQTFIADPTDWEKINGGCHRKCNGKLPCGHDCELYCHPFPHELVHCQQKCRNDLPCGHGPCLQGCGEPCQCKICAKDHPKASTTLTQRTSPRDKGHSAHSSSSESWNSFAKDESARYAVAASAPPLQHKSPSKENRVDELIGLLPEDQVTQDMKGLGFGLDGNASLHEQSSSGSLTLKAGGGKRKKRKEKVAVGLQGKVEKEDWSKKGTLLD